MSNSSKNLIKNVNSEAKGKNRIIENLPITVFRVSSKSSWGIDYINENVEKLTGYSKTDFISQELSWFDIVFKEDIAVIEKVVGKTKKNKNKYEFQKSFFFLFFSTLTCVLPVSGCSSVFMAVFRTGIIL